MPLVISQKAVKVQVDVAFWTAWQRGELPENATRTAHQLTEWFQNVIKDDMIIHTLFVRTIGSKSRAFVWYVTQDSPRSEVGSCVSVEDCESN